ncbi:MAG: fused response regulator/phosphatase [Firmicutes bacterium]|nr:fused response regulator/phosphatase [Bacillota bacterium]
MYKGLVLVVDDEPQIRDLLGFYLKRAGYQVMLAEHGREALRQMEKARPDLILSDLRMPELSGDEFCRMVKEDPATRDVYFVLVSAVEGMASRIGGLNLGADDMISKPFHAQEVVAKVESAFRTIGMQKEIKRQNQELARFRERITAELSLAARLQMGLLPALPGLAPGFRYTHRYLPAEGIGGDIYSILPTAEGGLALLLADVSGHGVTAALISAMVKTSFESHVRQSESPLVWAQGMNRDLARNTLSEQFATAFIAHIRPGGAMSYVMAGHEAPILLTQGAQGGLHQPHTLSGQGFMLGIEEDLPFEEKRAAFEPGDRLILFTDGLIEVAREDHGQLGHEGMARLCAELPGDQDAAADRLIRDAQAFIHPTAFTDDVTLVILDHL